MARPRARSVNGARCLKLSSVSPSLPPSAARGLNTACTPGTEPNSWEMVRAPTLPVEPPPTRNCRARIAAPGGTMRPCLPPHPYRCYFLSAVALQSQVTVDNVSLGTFLTELLFQSRDHRRVTLGEFRCQDAPLDVGLWSRQLLHFNPFSVKHRNLCEDKHLIGQT